MSGKNNKQREMNNSISLKILLLVFSFLLIAANTYSQKATSNPAVGYDSSSETSIMPITSVVTGLGDRKVTIVTFQYATTLFKAWIRLDPRTFLFDRAYSARIVSTDETNDLALLKVDASLSAVPYTLWSNPSDVGEEVFVLGYPQTQRLGEELKLTTGVISSRSGYRGDVTTYQVSAQVLAGNSGCPLFDNQTSYLKMLIDRTAIALRQPVSNTFSGKSLAERVKAVRNHVYIIEVQ